MIIIYWILLDFTCIIFIMKACDWCLMECSSPNITKYLLTTSFISNFFLPDDVYRRKQSEREYQQKITDGLIVPNEPAAKWTTAGFRMDFMCRLNISWTACYWVTVTFLIKESSDNFQHAGFIVYIVFSWIIQLDNTSCVMISIPRLHILLAGLICVILGEEKM